MCVRNGEVTVAVLCVYVCHMYASVRMVLVAHPVDAGDANGADQRLLPLTLFTRQSVSNFRTAIRSTKTARNALSNTRICRCDLMRCVLVPRTCFGM